MKYDFLPFLATIFRKWGGGGGKGGKLVVLYVTSGSYTSKAEEGVEEEGQGGLLVKMSCLRCLRF